MKLPATATVIELYLPSLWSSMCATSRRSRLVTHNVNNHILMPNKTAVATLTIELISKQHHWRFICNKVKRQNAPVIVYDHTTINKLLTDY